MSTLDRDVLAERTATLQRHLARVESLLPSSPVELKPMTNASDGVILHLWQSVQLAIDMALSACVRLGLGTPNTYAGSFQKLAEAGVIEAELADRLVRAAGFRNLLVHAYEGLDMAKVYDAAKSGPADLRAFFAALQAKAK